MFGVLLLVLCALAGIYAFNARVADRIWQDAVPEEVPVPVSPDRVAAGGSQDIEPLSPDAGPPTVRSPDCGRFLAIVMDDCGGNMDLARRVRSLDLPLTWAIIPNLRFSSETALLLAESDIPFLIHVPMQAIPDPDGKAGDPRYYYIGAGMSSADVREALNPLLDSLPGAYGINNHRGSKATEDRELMDSVMAVLKERGFFFMDSSTSRKTVAYEAAAGMGLRTAKNNRFLDNESDRAKISAQIEKAISSAKKSNQIAICHLRPETVAALEALSPDEIAKGGVRLVTLPQLMELEELSDE